MTINIPREQTEFVTPEGILSFPKLFPGQAEASQQSINKAYKCELVIPVIPADSAMTKAIALVAQSYDQSGNNPTTGQPNWHRHVYGSLGRLKKLEEMPRRDASHYPYAVGKYIVGFSKVISPGFLGMKDIDLSVPANKQKYEEGVNAHAPHVRRFANLSDPADIARIQQISQENALKGLAPITEANYSKTLLPVMPHEIWPGCIVQLAGRAYWDAKVHKTVLLSFDHVLLVRTGERLVGERSADSAFAGFAPSNELAPPAPSPFAMAAAPAAPAAFDPWKSITG